GETPEEGGLSGKSRSPRQSQVRYAIAPCAIFGRADSGGGFLDCFRAVAPAGNHRVNIQTVRCLGASQRSGISCFDCTPMVGGDIVGLSHIISPAKNGHSLGKNFGFLSQYLPDDCRNCVSLVLSATIGKVLYFRCRNPRRSGPD